MKVPKIEDLDQESLDMHIEKMMVLYNKGFSAMKPLEFYRFIFPKGSFEKREEKQQQQGNGILTVIDGEKNDSRIVFDDLKEIDKVRSTPFVVMSPISYFGKRRLSSMARYLYAIAIDLDEVGGAELEAVFGLAREERKAIPLPSLIVLSGRGVHLYYVLQDPVPLYRRNQHRINELKRIMTGHIWNRLTSLLQERNQVQYQSIFQGFRMPGTQSKIGGVLIDGYKTGNKYTIEQLQSYWDEAKALGDLTKYQPVLPIEKAKEKYPKWYQERIVEGKKGGRWHVKRALYDWWRLKISNEATEGHRYHCLSILATYAVKCDVSFAELESDVFKLQKKWENDRPNNIFTKKDAEDALKFFKESYINFPRQRCEDLSGIQMLPNKRNGDKQEVHLEIARSIRDIRQRRNGTKWDDHNGRKPKKEIVSRWKKYHPDGTPKDCIQETGLNKNTVYKWWNCCE